jgi:hypothetical protein
MSISDEKKLKELQTLMTGMVESVLSASDEEILQETKEQGLDLEKIAAETKETLLAAVTESKLRKLREARRQYERNVAAIPSRKVTLPATPAERRNLLAAVFARNATIQSGILTAQHRELKEMTDADVERLLLEIAALGLLGESEQ